MDTKALKQQVETIREAFGYINRFKGQTFVIRIDSSLIEHPFFPVLIKDIVLLHRMGIRIVLVPGSKQRIDEILNAYHVVCKSVNGVRITTPQAIPFIKMAAFDVSNKIMTMLAAGSADAVVGNWVRARGIGVRNGVDYQCSGIVESLKTSRINHILADELIPIFPNIGWNASGAPYNISSSELALAVAIELQASKLFFVSDFSGVSSRKRRIPRGVYVSSEGIIPQLTLDQAKQFLEMNPAQPNQPDIDLVSLAQRACDGGIDRVHIIDGRIEGMILKEIFSNRGLGTMIYRNQHENIRPMAYADIPEVLRIMQPLVESEALVPRTSEELHRSLGDYAVYEVDGIIHACCALRDLGNRQGEIYACAVDEMYANLGTGRKMVAYSIDRAKKARMRRVFLLTTQTADWFEQLGFRQARPADLPPQRRSTYDARRNSRVLALRLTLRAAKHAAQVD